jgi:hypothetical protein
MKDIPALAFPHKWETTDGTTIIAKGMTLRDYFATASIQTAMRMVKHDFNKDGEIFYWDKSEREIVASRAYDLADAMMKAREA